MEQPQQPQAPPTKAPLVSRKILAGVVAIVVVVVVAVVAAVLLRGDSTIGYGGPSGSSKLEMTITPSTLHVGDNSSLAASVTNNESGTMTLTGGTMKIYRNDQLLETSTGENVTRGFSTNTIPAGQTVYIIPSHPSPMTSTSSFGGVSYSMVADWRIELSLDTNFGTFTASCSCTVLA